jgi:zinc transporter ZupT
MAGPILAALAGMAGVVLGLELTALRQRARLVLPFSAGLLLGVALFGLLPELGLELGWPISIGLFGFGYLLLLSVNRYVYRVCPTCSHDHDHNSCSTELHGFAVPLIAAASLHSFLDGWSVGTVQLSVPLGLRVAVPLAVALHKLPEGIALGGMMRATMRSKSGALAWCLVAEGVTLLGGAVGLLLAPRLGAAWITYPIGVTAGWLFYLGYHAVHEEWKRKGPAPSFAAALCGIAGAALLQRGAEALFH